MRLEGKMIAEIHYKKETFETRRDGRIQDQNARTMVPEREINVRKTDLWDIQVYIQIIAIKI